ncbi:paired box protein Pax-3-like [Mytilus galloprovincialis]|uniref:paired box protein Pax-3-like n=1 Tax=Mytilus galloprovincialis TaxID=29158 RepID=UPI003F7B5743
MGSGTMTAKSKRQRTKYTKEQLEALERVFISNQYPDSLTTDELADQLEISNEKVSIWFQNRRSKFKRQCKDSQVTWMRNQVYDQENRPPVLTIPSEPRLPMKPTSDILGRPHVLTVSTANLQNTVDNKKPVSNLHYKPNADVLSTPLPWEHNFGYTTPSPPFDYSSCANDILKDCSVNPATTRPDYPIDIQYRGHVTPPGFWSPYVTSSIQPAPVRSCMFSNYPFFPQTQVTNQQLTLL